jgi:hypothetical protein
VNSRKKNRQHEARTEEGLILGWNELIVRSFIPTAIYPVIVPRGRNEKELATGLLRFNTKASGEEVLCVLRGRFAQGTNPWRDEKRDGIPRRLKLREILVE